MKTYRYELRPQALSIADELASVFMGAYDHEHNLHNDARESRIAAVAAMDSFVDFFFDKFPNPEEERA